MRKKLITLVVALLTLLGASARADECRVAEANAMRFGALLTYLARAYEQPSDVDGPAIEGELEAIAAVSARDHDVATAIVEHWQRVYLDPGYALNLNDGGNAEALAEAVPDGGAGHALVVLGFKLENGRMAGELKGRCDAAAVAARALPNAILVCSGGATGDRNPERHTEAGLMRDYLVEAHGIDPARIRVDEQAQTTVENAVNTYKILQAEGIRTMTIVTSSYHQRWGQAVYNAVAALYRQEYGYFPEIVSNYCYDTPPSSDIYRQDDRVAARQIASALNLPKKVTEKLKGVLTLG